MDKPMLGGCCVCLDERGWAENPLVYCDGQSCTIAVHQACYGIVNVPSGPWFCGKCETSGCPANMKCELCPHLEGALKKTDNQGWAHVVCALYIPEIQFGNVSTMEPIVLSKIPQERFDKSCYICEDNGNAKKSFGACMDCAKAGCKSSFHVTCAQISGLLCEEAGSSNTTKYCGYCAQHLSKVRKSNLFQSLAGAKAYGHLADESSKHVERLAVGLPSVQNNDGDTIECTEDKCYPSKSSEQDQNGSNKQNPEDISSKPNLKTSRLKRAKKISGCNAGRKKVIPLKKQNRLTATNTTSSNLLDDVGYATAPKHSVVTLSSFGDDYMVPSGPSDIDKEKLTMQETYSNVDGLSAIEQLMFQQKSDLLQFFQEFGSPTVAPVLQKLQRVREENCILEESIHKMTHGRDQLLAIKAKLSIPFKHATHVTSVVSSTGILDSKSFQLPD